MFSKKNRNQGPSWVEVVLAAILSMILGVAAAIVLLALRPVIKGAPPKDAPAGALYYVEGSRDFNRTPEVEAKKKRFVAGDSVTLQEGELNVLLGASAPTPAAPDPKKAADKDKPGDKPAVPDKLVDIGPLNGRIAGGKIQFGAPVTFSFNGLSEMVIVQTQGAFEKRGAVFAYVPETLYFGGCPLVRVPVLRDLVLNKLLFNQAVPSDLYTAWTKLAAVTIDGNTLHLRMP